MRNRSSIPKRLRHTEDERRFLSLLRGLVLSAGISLFAYRRRSLSKSGVPGAVLTGTTIFGLGGWDWALALIFFFGSSSLFSHFRARTKEQVAADKFSKGSQRDFMQVVANGGVATLIALGQGLAEPSLDKVGRDVLLAGFTGALATATADTWATELGVLSPQPPRLITTGRRVAPGTSGGITLTGTGASALGALAQGGVGSLLGRWRGGAKQSRQTMALPVIGLLSGLAGSLFDSLLGATVQAMYYCPACEKETERRVHSCGTPTRPLRGISWLNNDVVNFGATLFGSSLAMALYYGWWKRVSTRHQIREKD